jgi:hypothetical protein
MGTMDEHEACEAGQTVPIKVPGRTIGDPLALRTRAAKIPFRRPLDPERQQVQVRLELHVQVEQPRSAILAGQRSGVLQGIVRGPDTAAAATYRLPSA